MDPQGYDAGKKVTGRKRHILVDTLGLLLSVAVHPADIQDRDGVAYVLNASTRALFPFLERIFADGGYQGPRPAAAAAATGNGSLKSSSAMSCTSSLCYPSGGSSSEPSPGSAAIAAAPRLAVALRKTVRPAVPITGTSCPSSSGRWQPSQLLFVSCAQPSLPRVMLRRLTRPTPCP
jgi:hypothetical protein